MVMSSSLKRCTLVLVISLCYYISYIGANDPFRYNNNRDFMPRTHLPGTRPAITIRVTPANLQATNTSVSLMEYFLSWGKVLLRLAHLCLISTSYVLLVVATCNLYLSFSTLPMEILS